jgi:hypothetical protein
MKESPLRSGSTKPGSLFVAEVAPNFFLIIVKRTMEEANVIHVAKTAAQRLFLNGCMKISRIALREGGVKKAVSLEAFTRAGHILHIFEFNIQAKWLILFIMDSNTNTYMFSSLAGKKAICEALLASITVVVSPTSIFPSCTSRTIPYQDPFSCA